MERTWEPIYQSWPELLVYRALVPGVLALYLLSYFDGSPSSGKRYSKRVTHWSGWSWIWTKVLQLPLGEVHADAFEVVPDEVQPVVSVFGGANHSNPGGVAHAVLRNALGVSIDLNHAGWLALGTEAYNRRTSRAWRPWRTRG